MGASISLIIPCYNGGATIELCLGSVFSSRYPDFEVIVVDDCSTDDSVEKIKRFPCRLITLKRHSGASKARNIGALASKGDILFFIDADCLLEKETLFLVNKAVEKYGKDVIIGGTYTLLPYDDNFFSTFQSVFINYCETKRDEPDYIATHAMIISSEIFKENDGFREEFLPIIEDVEFSHRLKKRGYRLVMCPEIQVRHIFGFTLRKSLTNALRKSFYWTIYSLKNRDLFKDSGTASLELKINVLSCFLLALFISLSLILKKTPLLVVAIAVTTFNIFINMGLFTVFYRAKGILFAIKAAIYYMTLYALAVGMGALGGMVSYLLKRSLL